MIRIGRVILGLIAICASLLLCTSAFSGFYRFVPRTVRYIQDIGITGRNFTGVSGDILCFGFIPLVLGTLFLAVGVILCSPRLWDRFKKCSRQPA